MAEQKAQVFRKKSLDRISSPEQLTDYLRVTNPGIWVVLAAVSCRFCGAV
ncbi:MAG TPA: NHLP bacteriocin system secretion protein, partial [Ruminococcus sp.]|nr:NHLP bacteriocin system secretion protein [Ruminococcus sp.]